MAKSKYIMSRMSRHLKKIGLIEITPIELLSTLMNRDFLIIEPKIIYLNKDKTKGLSYIERTFKIVKQNDIITSHKDETIYNMKVLTNKEGFEMLNLMIRGEKLKKIKKKINN